MLNSNLMAQLQQQQQSELGNQPAGLVENDEETLESGGEEVLQSDGRLVDDSDLAEEKQQDEENVKEDSADEVAQQLAKALGVELDQLRDIVAEATGRKEPQNQASYTEAEIVQNLSVRWDMRPSEVRQELPNYVAYYKALPGVEQARIDAMGYEGFEELKKGLAASRGGDANRTQTTMNLGRSSVSSASTPKVIYASEVTQMTDEQYAAAQPAILAAIRAGTYREDS